MTLSNAFGFFLIGVGMLWLPVLAPGLIAGGSTRELWLLFMGMLNVTLGAGGLSWHALRQAWSLPRWLTRPAPESAPLGLPHPNRAGL